MRFIDLQSSFCYSQSVMSANEISEERLELYRKLLELHPNIDLKGAKKLSYTSINGHMFSQMTKDGRLGIRLSKEQQAAFITKYGTIPFRNYGANIRDYVEVPENLINDPIAFKPYLEMSLAYTKMLKPK